MRTRGLLAATVCAGFVLTLPGVFGQVIAVVEGVLFDSASAQTTNNTFTVSTTRSEHFTRVDLADLEVFDTRVVAVLDGAVVFDDRVGDAPGSPAVLAAFDDAEAALAEACTVTGPTAVSTSETSETVQRPDEFTGSLTDVTTTTTFGPATILIGENQSETFFVATGTLNINTNTHTSLFFDQPFQTVVTHHATVQLVGVPCGVPPPEPLAVLPAETPSREPGPATPVAAMPRTAG